MTVADVCGPARHDADDVQMTVTAEARLYLSLTANWIEAAALGNFITMRKREREGANFSFGAQRCRTDGRRGRLHQARLQLELIIATAHTFTHSPVCFCLMQTSGQFRCFILI